MRFHIVPPHMLERIPRDEEPPGRTADRARTGADVPVEANG
ncbi:hypothetical protein [Actinomadura sp. 3N407]